MISCYKAAKNHVRLFILGNVPPWFDEFILNKKKEIRNSTPVESIFELLVKNETIRVDWFLNLFI